MNRQLQDKLNAELKELQAAGTYKTFNVLESPMDATVVTERHSG